MIKVYQQSAQVLDKLFSKKGSLKSLCLDQRIQNKKATYALVCQSLKYKPILSEMISDSKLLKKEPSLSFSLALVLLHDFFYAKRGIQCGHPWKLTIHKHKDLLHEMFKAKCQSKKVLDPRQLVSEKAKALVDIPKYARVNTLLISVEDAIAGLVLQGFMEEPFCPSLVTSNIHFQRDLHLNYLLIFHSRTDFHQNTLYQEGKIILQDKASCFPAHVLSPPENAVVMDACAAPGNKTSHLSALMNNTGTIFAIDLDARRLETLKRLTGKAGCKNIIPRHGSFLDIQSNDPNYAKVEYLLLDPSCSGSGIVSRLDQLIDTEDVSQERLASLSSFQKSCLLHAANFPNLKSIVYSTCSIFQEENEDVVKHVLLETSKGYYRKKFILRDKAKVLPEWPSRGLDISTLTGDGMIRSYPEKDFVNGFFVACFDCIDNVEVIPSPEIQSIQHSVNNIASPSVYLVSEPKSNSISQNATPPSKKRKKINKKQRRPVSVTSA